MGVYNAVAVNLAANDFNFHDVPVFLYSFTAVNADRDCGLFGGGGVGGYKLSAGLESFGNCFPIDRYFVDRIADCDAVGVSLNRAVAGGDKCGFVCVFAPF